MKKANNSQKTHTYMRIRKKPQAKRRERRNTTKTKKQTNKSTAECNDCLCHRVVVAVDVVVTVA